MEKSMNRKENIVIIIIVILALLMKVMPMIILQEDYIFPVHDGLDSIGKVQIIGSENIEFSTTANMPVIGDMPVVFATIGITTFNILIYNLNYVLAIIINQLMYVPLGYFCMLALLKRIFIKKSPDSINILRLVAAAYAVIPISFFRGVPFATLPLLALIFWCYMDNPKFDLKVLLLAIYPIFSTFSVLLIFLCALWALGIIIVWIVKKKLNINLVVGFIVLSTSAVLTNMPTFIVAGWDGELNRSLMSESGDFFAYLFTYLADGQLHAPSVHLYWILPVSGIGMIIMLYLVFIKKLDDEQKEYWKHYFTVGFIVCVAIFVFSTVAALKTSGLLEETIDRIIPLLNGFNWSRVIHLTRPLWYILFAVVLVAFANSKPKRIIAYLFVCIQIIIIYITPGNYNDVGINLKYLFNEKPNDIVTLREFYSEDLFSEIKNDIDYNHEIVAALGYHPDVLMYNDFYTMDGYLTLHSLDWHLKFREVIEPELNENEWARDYYDSWGGRMYLYCEDIDFEPSRTKEHDSVTCRINIEAFTELKGKYILSRAEIENADDLYLDLVNVYDNSESIYRIYVYENSLLN